MSKNWKQLFTIGSAIVGVWLIYALRRIIKPFILAAIFAYILSPLVNFLTEKTKLPRLVFVITLYGLIVTMVLLTATNISLQLTRESRELVAEAKQMSQLGEYQLTDYPDWLRPVILDLAQRVSTIRVFTPERLGPYFSGAISGLEYTLLFLFASFYFLKDGHTLIEALTKRLPTKKSATVGTILQQVNMVFNDYLRGQIFLIILMAVVSWVVLSLLHVKYALILGIFTGFAEIVPFIGPILAGATAALVAMTDGVSTLSLPPLSEGILIALVYFVLRMLEDYLIIPTVIGKTTHLHPLLVLFAVIAGGQLWGILGMVLAVPMVVFLRIIFLHAD